MEFLNINLSTNAIKSTSPILVAYQMGVDALMLQPEEILSAPFGGWDATSAKMFGYTTFLGESSESPS
jgi:2-haloacid dehalogenase